MVSYFDPKTATKDVRIAIANRIRQERKNLGLSQKDFADLIGYSKPTVGSWEHKDGLNRIPDFDQIIALCGAFHCEPDYLLCIIDTKSRRTTDVQSEIGLTPAAIDILRLATQTSIENDSPRRETLRLINEFILNCEPIAEYLTDLFNDIMYREINRISYTDAERKKLEIFDEIYNSNSPEFMKPMLFIEKAIEVIDYGWCGEGQCETQEEFGEFRIKQKDRYYQDYMRFVDERKSNRTPLYRYNIDLIFNQIIDGIIHEYEKVILRLNEDY